MKCCLFTTDRDDLVLKPTCGSGTMAFVPEQRSRRRVTRNPSRVPLALARQRLLTATFDNSESRDMARGTVGEYGQIAVKVIDPRGNVSFVVKKLEEVAK